MPVKPERAFDVCWEVYRNVRAVLDEKRGASSAQNWIPNADITSELATIKADLKWIKSVAIAVVSVAIPTLGWLFFQYVPEKIQSGKTDVKSELGERIAKVEDGVERVGKDIERLEREIKQTQAAFAQLRVKPSELRKLPPTEISRKFDEVIGLIDSGLAQKKPPPSVSLAGGQEGGDTGSG